MGKQVPAGTFLNPPQIFTVAEDGYQPPESRRFEGIPSIAVSPGGRLWATWYAGPTPGEDPNNYVVLATSGDRGATWSEIFIVDPDGPGPVRAFDPEIWTDPQGRLWLFWAQHAEQNRLSPHAGVWAMINATPEDPAGQWTAPRRLTEGIMMCKPTVLASGRWLLPASTWRATDYSARAVASDDAGRSFEVIGACQVPVEDRSFDEHMIVERCDGSLWMLIRTRYGIGQSLSSDGGRTWSVCAPSPIAHTSSRFFIRRLRSGALLLVKHGRIDEAAGRSHLTAMLSDDDGVTWTGGLLLDERPAVSYPSGQEAADGTIVIAYDHSRTGARAIHMAAFTEADVRAGRPISAVCRLRQRINRETAPAVYDNADGAALNRQPAGRLDCDSSAGVQDLATGALLFADRDSTLAECPEALAGATFLRLPMEGTKTLTCTAAGTVCFLTPRPDRSADTQEAALRRAGFRKVALREFNLGSRGDPAGFVSLYQKTCAVGDVVTIGRWAVPVQLP